MRKYIKLVFVISIILVSSLVLIIGIYIPSIKESKKSYIATDDTYHGGIDYDDVVNGNKAYSIAGRYINETFWSSWFYTFIKFDLTDKPKTWDRCELSFYVYEYERNYWDANFMLLFDDWNKQMNAQEIRENLPTHSAVDFYWVHSLGLQKINITNYIGDNECITIRIGAHGTYRVGSSLRFINNYIMMYSKEANVEKAWLPQLIWS